MIRLLTLKLKKRLSRKYKNSNFKNNEKVEKIADKEFSSILHFDRSSL